MFGRPASSTPMRATFMPCSPSGMAQPMMASSMRLRSMPGACATTAAQHVRQHVVGTGVAEHAARRLADRGAGGGDDVGVLDLLGHFWFSWIVGAQFLSGLPVFSMCAMRSWVFGICASATKCSRSSSSSHSSSTSEPRSTSPPHSTVAMRVAISIVVLGDEAALEHVDQHHLEGGDADVAGDLDLRRAGSGGR